jgi:signal transduction histidine kinase
MGEQESYEVNYYRLLDEFLCRDREKALAECAKFARKLAGRQVGPDVLANLHTASIEKIAAGKDAQARMETAMAASEFLLAGIAAFAEGFRKLMDRVEAEKKKAEQEHAQIIMEVESRKSSEEQLREGQKMEALSTLAGGIAHGFNNMLAAIMGNAELALDDIEEASPPHHNVEQILKAAKRGRELVKQILTFTRNSQRHEEVFSLTPVIEETLNLLRGSVPSSITISLSMKSDPDTMRGEPSEIQQVLVNLITNATHAMRENGGKLDVSLRNADVRERERNLRPGKYVVLKIRDTGVGMDRATLRRIFDPFFTTKEPGHGAGMGLSVVYGIVKAHRGAVVVTSEPRKGSAFSVYLPVGEPPAPSVVSEARAPGWARRPTILFVDDEELIRNTISSTLQRAGYTVVVKNSGEEALRFFTENQAEIDIVITDEIMPGIRGTALAAKLKKLRPHLPVILLTGYDQGSSSEEKPDNIIHRRLLKPIMKHELLDAIEHVTIDDHDK